MFVYKEGYESREEGYYYSCPWIEHGLVFFPHKLAFCCYSGFEGNGHTLVQNNFGGQKIHWSRINDIKDKFRYFHKSGKIHTSCIGCPFLEYKKWDGGNYISNLYISHWTYCNSRCIYCYENQKPDEFIKEKGYNVLPFIKEMFDIGILRTGGMIYFGGGEPTLLSEFEELITYFLDNFFWNIRVHTSGIKFSRAMTRAIEESRGAIVASVDSGSREIYKKIKRVDCYEQVCENLRKYALYTTYKSRYNVSSKYIIIPGINDNKEEIEKWLQANYRIGLWTTVMDIEEGWYLKNRNNIPQYIFELIKYAKKRSKHLHTNFEMYERMRNMVYEEYKKTGKYIVKND